MRRTIRRRLVALCRAGKAAPAGGLDSLGLRPRLEPSAPADEFDVGLLCPHRSVALRDARHQGNTVADSARRPLGWRTYRLQRARRADGLVAFRAATGDQSARGFQTR